MQQLNHDKAGWRIDEWRASTGIGRSRIYELIADGSIESVKVGTSRIITTPPREFLASQATNRAA